MTAAYGGGALGWVSPQGAPALFANLIGAVLVLISLLAGDFNLAATIMESIWALVAVIGLIKLATRRTR